jgi:uncharacterized protein YndB with AHSA1/START domain
MYGLNLERKLSTHPAKAFDAFTEPDWVVRWFAPGDMTVPDAVLDFRPEGHFWVSMQEPDGEVFTVRGQYLDIVEDESLRFSWKWDHGETISEVTVLFAELDHDKTLVTLIHNGFKEEAHKENHLQGWNGCLDKLQTLFEVRS